MSYSRSDPPGPPLGLEEYRQRALAEVRAELSRVAERALLGLPPAPGGPPVASLPRAVAGFLPGLELSVRSRARRRGS